MGSSQMDKLFTVFGKTFYYAGNGFVYRGLFVWTGRSNRRILAFNKFSNWYAEEYDDIH